MPEEYSYYTDWMPLIKAHIQKHIGFGKKNGFTVKSGKKISGRSEGPILFGTNVFFLIMMFGTNVALAFTHLKK